jgi:dephospho-CoA kinase
MDKKIIAFVGMAGSGKSEVVSYVEKKGVPFIRFGQFTDEGLKEKGLPITPENERTFREQLRSELGMAAYAIKAAPSIESLLKTNDVVAIDGLYSWEEYVYLLEKYPQLIVVHVYAPKKLRYDRLQTRSVRPFTHEEAVRRDFDEIDKLHKGGPIAIADFIVNNNKTITNLHSALDNVLLALDIKI